MADQFTRPQIRDRLTAFVARWSQRAGDEKSEAQTFLGELLDSYETGWRQNTDVRFEHHFPSGGFADLLRGRAPGRLRVPPVRRGRRRAR
jgi:hypothetical protein